MTLHRIALPAALLALAGLLSPLHAQQDSSAGAPRRSGIGAAMLPSDLKAPASRVITDAELQALRTASYGGQEAPKPLPPKKHGFSLVEMSTILANAGQSALLPKGSVIYCPETLKPRIVSTPSGATVPWQEFLTANRNWITTTEVDLKQVQGEKPLSDALLQSFRTRNMMVVATLNGCPVTVLPYSPANVPK